MKSIQNRRALSPVIATVILVAVAITVAVAVAYWMGGIAGQYTKFEKVEIISAICTKESDGNWTVTMKLKNSGTATSTLVGAFINEYDVTTGLPDGFAGVADDIYATNMTSTETILSGATIVVQFHIDPGYKGLTSGTTVNIKIHSAGGMDYVKLVELV